MTKDEILNMPAGREMDALIAERLFGLVPCTNEWHKNGDGLPCHAQPESPDQGGETHCYSTDISAAWEVVEKMSHGYQISVWTDFAEHWRGYGCSIRVIGTENRQVISADTAPLAICRAALLAVTE